VQHSEGERKVYEAKKNALMAKSHQNLGHFRNFLCFSRDNRSSMSHLRCIFFKFTSPIVLHS
jgi:hypothetical protein